MYLIEIFLKIRYSCIKNLFVFEQQTDELLIYLFLCKYKTIIVYKAAIGIIQVTLNIVKLTVPKFAFSEVKRLCCTPLRGVWERKKNYSDSCCGRVYQLWPSAYKDGTWPRTSI